MGLIFLASSLPGKDVHLPAFYGSDKLAHFLVYGVLGAALCWGHFCKAVSLAKKAALWLWLIGAFYGATDEFHQHFVPNRSVSAFDWLADSLGVALGIWILSRWVLRRAKPIRRSPTP